MSDKVKIRSKLLKIRTNLPEEVRLLKSRKIAEKLNTLPCFKTANHILFYYSHNKEVDTLELIENYLDSKRLYLPVIHGKNHFQATPIHRPLQLKTGAEGVPEPVDIKPNSLYDNQIQITITPGVAFDKKGNRIGMGKGYYDRYFEEHNSSIKIGLAYEEQVLDSLPKDPYDEPVNFIVTDQNIYEC